LTELPAHEGEDLKYDILHEHVLVEVVDGKEVMRVDNIMADVPADDRVGFIEQIYLLKNRLLTVWRTYKPDHIEDTPLDIFANYSNDTILLHSITPEGATLLDRIVASV